MLSDMHVIVWYHTSYTELFTLPPSISLVTMSLFLDLSELSPTRTLQSWLTMALMIIFRYYAIVYPLHVLLWVNKKIKGARRLTLKEPTLAVIQHEQRLSNISAFIYALPASIVFDLWRWHGKTKMYATVPSCASDWLYLVASGLFYLIVQDAHFYWTHRLMHTSKWCYKYMHAGHHKSIQPTPWASFSFDALEAISAAWVLPALILIVPIHVYLAAILLIFMTVVAILNHAGWEVYPAEWLRPGHFFGDWIITASHHNKHHTHYLCNYGLYWRFWDKVCGTDGGLQACVTSSDETSAKED